MTGRPYQSPSRREDLASDALRTADFTAMPGLLYPVDLTDATGDVTCKFPSAGRLHRANAIFGVIVTKAHATHRLVFDPDGEFVHGAEDPSLSAFTIGDPDSDRPEFVIWQLMADGSWYVVNDGRRRIPGEP